MRRLRPVLVASVAALLFPACAREGNNDSYVGDDSGVGPRTDASTGAGSSDDSGLGSYDSATGNDSGGTGANDAAADSASASDAGGTGNDAGIGSDSSTGSCTAVTVTPPAPQHGGAACVGDAGTCWPQNETTFSPTWVAPVGPHASTCTSTQINAFYDDCFGPNASAVACTTWEGTSANASCFACLSTDHTASKYGALVNYGNVSSINTAGCLAAAEPCNQPCAQAMQDDMECENSACDPSGVCNVVDQASFTTYQTCVQQADSTCGCSGFASSAQCVTQINTGAHPAYADCFGSNDPSTATFQQMYTAVATFLCGP